MQKWRQWEAAPHREWSVAVEREAVIRPLAELDHLTRTARARPGAFQPPLAAFSQAGFHECAQRTPPETAPILCLLATGIQSAL
jgi:hypothetical protein